MAKKLGMVAATKKNRGMLDSLIPDEPMTPETKVEANTTPRRGRPASADKSKVFSVAATEGLYMRLIEAAKRHNVSKNGLHRYLLIDGLRRLESGELKLPTKQQPQAINME